MSNQALDARLKALFDKWGGGTSTDAVKKARNELNRATTEVTISYSKFYTGLKMQYEQLQRKTGNSKENPKVIEDLKSMAKDFIEDWKKFSKSKGWDKENRTVSSSGNVLKFTIVQKTKAAAGMKQKGSDALRNNFELFRKANASIIKPLVNNPKYKYLWTGTTKSKKSYGDVKKGDLFNITNIGHDLSVAEKGVGGLVAGEFQDILEDASLKLTDSDKTEIRKLRKTSINGTVKMKDAVRVSKKGGRIRKSTSVTMTVETDFQNKTKAAQEKKAGLALFGDIEQGAKDYKASTYFKQKGSPSLQDYVADAIINTAQKKGMYRTGKAHNLTRYKRELGDTNKVQEAKSIKNKIENNNNKINFDSLNASHASLLPRSKAGGGGSAEKGSGITPEKFANQIAKTLKVKNAINKRLPAEIKRNMGRPALNNRTGRFRTSAMIEDITPAAKTLMVKYTYRLNPYETFENTGKRKWPNGYNPKPLISKSIRNLALSMFKITNLTTRRV